MRITQYLCCGEKMDPGFGSETSEDHSFENRGRKRICCIDQWVKTSRRTKRTVVKPIELTKVNA